MITGKTQIEGALTFVPGVFEDYRGYYVETFNVEAYRSAGVTVDFVVDDMSVSRHGVLRGLLGDSKTWKLVSCPMGEIYLAILDCRKDSPSRGKWQGFTISDRNRLQVLVPPGVANGHTILSDKAIFHYKQSQYYDPDGQFTVKWNDPSHGILWPVDHPILSARDR